MKIVNFTINTYKLKAPLFIILASIIVAIVGEFKIYPFGNETFRFGLGPIVLSFIILISNIKVLPLSMLTAFFVICFRTILSILMTNSHLIEAIIYHLPAGIFYIIFGLCMQQLSIRKFRDLPLQLYLFIALFEIISNIMEALTIIILIQNQFISFNDILLIISVALIRGFIVVSFYTSILFTGHKQKLQKMLKLHSDLYTESMYMQQTMVLIEQVTKDQYLLYKELQEKGDPQSLEALRITSELHEIKKNTQRAVAGLSNLIIHNKDTSYSIEQIIDLVKVTQARYADFLNKDIKFKVIGTSYYETKNYLPILSILNNILSNAVEAIEYSGYIQIEVKEYSHEIIFTLSNNGQPIPEQNIPLLFEPGYTTKFDRSGNASTGIGLHHVQTLVEKFEGSIEVSSNAITTFQIKLNKQKL